jgi:acyl-CoA synthetase (AMP-forming)/AMP-acid ligase II
MIRRLINCPGFPEFDLSSLRLLTYGAAPIDETLLTRAVQAFPNAEFFQGYGMTECAPTVTVLPGYAHLPHSGSARLRSAGLPVELAEVGIVDVNDQDVGIDRVGEIVVRGPMVMQGYWNKPDETASALRGGWMHTGDVGYRDTDGFIYIVDRAKDMIVSGGENVYSGEVENAISQLPSVSMCAVIGIPDEAFGEGVHAIIVLRAGFTVSAEDVKMHCRTLIAGYKCPRSIEFRDELPLSAAGKLLKYQLREPFWQGRTRRIN